MAAVQAWGSVHGRREATATHHMEDGPALITTLLDRDNRATSYGFTAARLGGCTECSVPSRASFSRLSAFSCFLRFSLPPSNPVPPFIPALPACVPPWGTLTEYVAANCDSGLPSQQTDPPPHSPACGLSQTMVGMSSKMCLGSRHSGSWKWATKSSS